MAVNPMLNTGAAGIARGMRSLESVAQEIAEFNIKSNPSESAGDGESRTGFALDEMSSAIVDLKLYQRQVEAATQVVKTADEVIGFLLDVRA